ncbi:MAG: DegV family protein, partial [Actinomycetes bacterium]
VPLEKVRTGAGARARLVELAVWAAGQAPVDFAVHHLGAPARAVELVEQLHARLPASTDCLISEVGAAIGAHAGLGMLGVVVLPGGLGALTDG